MSMRAVHTHTEPESLGPFDVVVAGGGLAGLCAALAAAREGARVALVHDRPVLGGNSSTEIRIPPFGGAEHNPWGYETGIIAELLAEERARNHERVESGHANAVWDLVQYEACRRETNLALVLNCSVYAVEMAGAGEIAAVLGVQGGTQKRLRITGRLFVDATGDGAVGVPAGVPWRVGQESRAEYGETMAPAEGWPWTLGSSLLFRARDTGRPVAFAPPPWAEKYLTEDALAHRSHRQIDGGYWWIEIGHPYDTLAQNEELRDELLRHVLGVWDHIKNHCTEPGVRERARTYALDWIGMVPAKRETRRFVGAHVLTQTEIARRELFPDRIGYGGWIIDDHTKAGILARGKHPSFDNVTEAVCEVSPYSVPLRSLYTREVGNLFLAGRVMSASRLAFNSLRVMRTLAGLGQAAGAAAAYSAAQRRLPADLTPADVGRIQQRLLRQDATILRLPALDPDDLACGARIAASSAAPWPAEFATEGLPFRGALAQLVPVTAARIDRVGLALSNSTGAGARVHVSLHAASDVWDLAGLRSAALASAECTVDPGPARWLKCALGCALEPGRLYWVRVEALPGVLWHFSRDVVPGATAARLDGATWRFAPGSFHVWRHFGIRAEPATAPFGPENATNGVARPEQWPNLWISDPAQSLPQWLEMEFARPGPVAEVHVVTDTDIARPYMQRPPFFRAPECVRDFDLALRENGQWRLVAQVRDNYQRFLRLPLAGQTAEALRLTVLATNGAASARVYAVRVYRK